MVATAAGPQGQPVAVGEPEREHAALGQDAGQGGEQGRLVVDPGEQVVADDGVEAVLGRAGRGRSAASPWTVATRSATPPPSSAARWAQVASMAAEVSTTVTR